MLAACARGVRTDVGPFTPLACLRAVGAVLAACNLEHPGMVGAGQLAAVASSAACVELCPAPKMLPIGDSDDPNADDDPLMEQEATASASARRADTVLGDLPTQPVWPTEYTLTGSMVAFAGEESWAVTLAASDVRGASVAAVTAGDVTWTFLNANGRRSYLSGNSTHQQCMYVGVYCLLCLVCDMT